MKIVERKIDPPRTNWGMTAAGYTKRGGAPSQWKVRLEGERRWRRVMVLQFSNAGSAFLRVRGVVHFVNDAEFSCVPVTRSER